MLPIYIRVVIKINNANRSVYSRGDNFETNMSTHKNILLSRIYSVLLPVFFHPFHFVGSRLTALQVGAIKKFDLEPFLSTLPLSAGTFYGRLYRSLLNEKLPILSTFERCLAVAPPIVPQRLQ
jgi:hypothetical protein